LRPGPRDEAPAGAWPVDHTADIALRVKAPSLEEFFRHAALGLVSLMADTTAIEPHDRRSIELSGLDLEELLVSWLGELLHESEDRGALLAGIEDLALTVDEDLCLLRAVCWFEAWDEKRYPRRSAIKAVTYHGLSIDPRSRDGYDQTIVFDT